MREPRLGDTIICRDWPPGRIDMVTEYEGFPLVGVKFEGSFLRQFFPRSQLDWERDCWVVKEK